MEKMTFIINTEAAYFANWLEKYTADAPNESFPTDKGRIGLQRARRSTRYVSSNVMAMDGYYIYPNDDGTSERAWPVSELIRFEMTPLSQNRTDVTSECNQWVVLPYFCRLLGAVAERWPEAVPKLMDQVLGRRAEHGLARHRMVEDLPPDLHARLEGCLDELDRRLTYLERSSISPDVRALQKIEAERRGEQKRAEFNEWLRAVALASTKTPGTAASGPASGDTSGKRGGNPGLSREEWVKRLALAKQGEYLHRKGKSVTHTTWEDIVRRIRWPYGSSMQSKVRLLLNARRKLAQLQEDGDPDGLLADVERQFEELYPRT